MLPQSFYPPRLRVRRGNIPDPLMAGDQENAMQPAATQDIFLARHRAEREIVSAIEALGRKTKELAEQRELFRVTLSSIGDAVITTDTEARVTFLNPVAEALTGWSLGDATGELLGKVFHIIHEETRDPAPNPVEAVLRKGITVELANHTVLIAKDGRETPIEDSAAPIRDVNGTMIGAVMVFHDVTVRRQSGRALRQSETRLNLALQAGQMGAWEWMIPSGKVVWSPTLEAIHGLPPGTFRGRLEDFERDMHPEDRTRVLAEIQQCVRNRCDYEVEYRVIKPDGSLAWIESRGKLFVDQFGTPERMVGICTDITARREVQEALRTSEKFNRTIIESSGDCAITLSLNGVLLWMSDTTQRILRVSDVNSLIGTSWVDFWKGADREAALVALRAAAGGGNGKFIGWHAIEGEARCWDVVITPMLDRERKPGKLLALARDVTERSKLEEVHSRLAALVEFSNDAIISKNLDGIIMTWNRGAERIFGYTAAEVIGKPVTILFAPGHTNEELAILARIGRGEPVLPFETTRMHKNGSLLHVSLTVSPIKDASGTIIGASKIARDITQHKRAEAERIRLTRILEKSLNEIYIFDTDRLYFQYVNEGALRNLGYSMDEMRQMTPLDLKPDFTEAEYRRLTAPLLCGEREKLVLRAVHRRSDGSHYPVEIHLQSVTHSGESVFMAVTLDISERKKAEEERERLLALEKTARTKAEEAETRVRFLAEASGSLMSTLDYEITLQNLARAAVPAIADWCAVHLVTPGAPARLVTLEHADPAKLSLGKEYIKRYPEFSASSMEAVLQNRKAQLYTRFPDSLLAGYARDEAQLALLRTLDLSSAIIVPLIANERILGAISLVTAESGRHFTSADLPFAEDLAARVAAAAENMRLYQELRHANAAKDHFIAVLSHELRTPLNPVLMTVTDLEGDEQVPAIIREQLTVVRRNVELEARLIDDLLDSTRIASGKLQLYRTIVDNTELVRRAVAIVEGEARAKGVRLDIDLCTDPCPVDADPARLQQVIWNVVKNAVKFTPAGGLVRLSCHVQHPGRIRVIVEDNGIGIEAEHLGKIFNAFEQGDLRTGHRFGGLGLGLAISKALVTLHGGSLTAQSAGSGLGATFIIELPLAVPPVVTLPSGPQPPAIRRQLRLLLVEDHEATARVMVQLLTKRGYSVSAASSMHEALQALDQISVDLLISDLGLPDGTGHELMEKIREKQKLPGIALSGYGTEADVAQSNAVGFNIHLTKPVDINRLDHEIQSLFKHLSS